MTTTSSECSTCGGTGYYHGHGGPCAVGCRPPSPSSGLRRDALPADVVRVVWIDVRDGAVIGDADPQLLRGILRDDPPDAAPFRIELLGEWVE